MNSVQASEINNSETLDIAYNLVVNIRNFIRTSDILEEMYVYYPEIDLVIGQKGAFTSYVYFKAENPSKFSLEEEYASWKSQFDVKVSGFYAQQNTNEKNTIYFVQKQISPSSNSKRVVVAKIGETQMNDVFQSLISTSCYDYAALVDTAGSIYAQAGDSTHFVDEFGHFNYWDGSGRFSVCIVQSESWPFQFVTIQDFNTAYQSVYKIMEIIIISIILIAFISYFLALVFAKQDQFAVDQLANRFGTSDSQTAPHGFDYICAEIDKLIVSNASAIEAAEQQQKLIHSFFLKDFLMGKANSKQSIERLCSTCQIYFENTLFSMIVMKPECPITNEECRFIDSAVASCDNDNFNVIWAVVSDYIVVLCNFDATTRIPQAPVITLAKELNAFITGEIEVSPLSSDVSSMIGFWNKICGILETSKQELSAQAKQKETTLIQEFNTAIDRDDLSAAILMASSLQKCFISMESEKLALCYKHMLLAKLYEHYDVPSIISRLDALYLKINSADWTSKLSSLLQEIDQDINRKIDVREVAEIAKEIIVQEYNNPQLSLQMIADRICISQSYLCRLFKGKYGISVIQYLNQVRIEHAKELMLSSKDSLNVIALQCGFTSNINLIRVFKKIENTTPGNFRNCEEIPTDNTDEY